MRLAAAGVLISRRSGNRVYYQANKESPFYPELQGVLVKTSGLVWILKDGLEEFGERIAVAFVYGSVAIGEEVSSSDVDLFVVGDVGLSELAPRLREVANRLGREVHPTVYTEAEVAQRSHSKDRFLRSVLDKPKLFVVGTEDDLRRASRPAPNRRGADRPR